MLFPLKHDIGLPPVPPSSSFTNNCISSSSSSSAICTSTLYTPAIPAAAVRSESAVDLIDLTLEFTYKSQNYDHQDYNYNVCDNRCGYLPLDASGAGGMSRELLLEVWGQTFAQCVHSTLYSTPTPAATRTADVIDLSSTVIIDLGDDSKPSTDKHTTTPMTQPVSVPVTTPYVDHYQPKTVDAFTGTAQEGPVGELYTWLQTWLDQQGQVQAYNNTSGSSSSSQNKKSKRAKKGQNYDDFLDDDDENDENTTTNTNEQTSNILIIQGPTGAGKTNAVYTCARTLGLGVIEVNPGQDRKAEIKTLAAAGSQQSKVQYTLYITSTL